MEYTTRSIQKRCSIRSVTELPHGCSEIATLNYSTDHSSCKGKKCHGKWRLQHHPAGWADTTLCRNAQTQPSETASNCFKKQPLRDLKTKLLMIQYGEHQAVAHTEVS